MMGFIFGGFFLFLLVAVGLTAIGLPPALAMILGVAAVVAVGALINGSNKEIDRKRKESPDDSDGGSNLGNY